MKSYFKRFLTVILTTALLIGSFAFITSPDSALAATKKKSQPKISISKTSVFLLKGQTTTLKVKNAKGKIVWKSSKSSVVKVSKGKLTALKAEAAADTKVGNLAALTTNAKTTVVAAVNELAARKVAHIEASTAQDVNTLVTNFNALLTALQTAGLMAAQA